jgi:hypothetical protein
MQGHKGHQRHQRLGRCRKEDSGRRRREPVGRHSSSPGWEPAEPVSTRGGGIEIHTCVNPAKGGALGRAGESIRGMVNPGFTPAPPVPTRGYRNAALRAGATPAGTRHHWSSAWRWARRSGGFEVRGSGLGRRRWNRRRAGGLWTSTAARSTRQRSGCRCPPGSLAAGVSRSTAGRSQPARGGRRRPPLSQSETGPALLRRAEPPLLKLLTRIHDVRVAYP